MKHGAVLMMDALGFKGIWQREPPDLVLETMKTLATAMQDQCESYRTSPPLRGHPLDEYRIEFGSDSVLIAVSVKGVGLTHQYGSVVMASALASQFVCKAALAAVPLTYRGCLALGEFIIDKPFMIGPAIDEAAAGCETAEGAFVWVRESAFDSPIMTADRRAAYAPQLVDYEVPFKDDSCRRAMVVSPFSKVMTPEERAGIADRIERTFSPEVAKKKRNTMEFLRYAEKL